MNNSAQKQMPEDSLELIESKAIDLSDHNQQSSFSIAPYSPVVIPLEDFLDQLDQQLHPQGPIKKLKSKKLNRPMRCTICQKLIKKSLNDSITYRLCCPLLTMLSLFSYGLPSSVEKKKARLPSLSEGPPMNSSHIILFYYSSYHTSYLCNKYMQELHLLIKERFQRVGLIVQGTISPQAYQSTRQEQKIRCEKESWILSMLRSKKSLTLQQKNIYFSQSHEIMKVIDPQFLHQKDTTTDDTFLNDFVCLYSRFFEAFESKFSFKLKLKNLLRPTNHNIVVDLIKYLSDFSRDYFQQIFYWHTKINKPQPQVQGERISFFKEKPQQNYSFEHRAESKKVQEQTDIRQQFQRIYSILEPQPFSHFVYAQKSKNNVDMIKLRLNEMYRQLKYRNNFLKPTIQQYYNNYFPQPPPKPTAITDSSFRISAPFNVSITIEKNGFSSLNVQLLQKQRQQKSLSPLKMKRLPSFCNPHQNPERSLQATPKRDIMINSLKILRVSQNYLPPLLLNFNEGKIKEYKDRVVKMENINQRKEEPKEVRYFNDQLERQSSRIKQEKKRMKDIRMQFTSEQKIKKRKPGNDSEEKILEWLDRINMMKQIERKKILGIN